MNARALKDFFKMRLCLNAQTEIRIMATRMLELLMKTDHSLIFKEAGPLCRSVGYCVENKRQHKNCNLAGIKTKSDIRAFCKGD